MLRLLVYPQPAQPAAPGTYRYINAAVGPFQRAYFSTQTFPFRVRGTQVCVLQDNQPQSNALIYRLQTGAERGGQVMGGASAPGHSDTKCYLIGRGQLGLNDRLLALLPILHTAAYDVYYTSPVNPSTGLPGYTVAQAGVQTVTVSSDNSLVLFGLDVALEWDASKDTTYLTQLQYDLNRTSELLYGWSNGQAALGRIRIFHHARRQPAVNGFQPWLNSHIRIYASNAVHPNAIQGGIVPDGSVQFISSDPNTGCAGAVNDPYTDFLAKYHPNLAGCPAAPVPTRSRRSAVWTGRPSPPTPLAQGAQHHHRPGQPRPLRPAPRLHAVRGGTLA